MKLLFAGLICLFTGLATASESLLIAGFETPQETAQWRPPSNDSSRMAFNADPQYVTEGKGSALLNFPKAGNGEGRWPRLVLKNLPLRDWSSYDELSVDVINPGPGKVNFQVQLVVDGGGKLGKAWKELTPGVHHLVWTLPEALKIRNVLNVLFYQSDPPENYILYADNLRIHLKPESIQKRLDTFFTDDLGQWKEADLESDFRKLQDAVEKLKHSNATPIRKAEILSTLGREYRKLKTRRDLKLNERKAAAFNKAFPGVWGYGVTHSLEKVFREGYPYRGGIGGDAKLSLARNEREAFQVVLRSKKAVEHVKATVSDLVNTKDSGAVLKSDTITIFPVGYVKPVKPPYPTEDLEWYPDPLLNFLPDFTLDANVWQPIWFDVRTTPETRPGCYRGTITVSGEHAPELKIPVQVTVWNFTLPKQNSLPTVIAHGNPSWFYSKNVKGSDLVKIERDAEDILLQHRITPSPIYNSTRAVTVDEVKRWQAAGGKEYNIIYIPPRPTKANEPYPGWARQRVLKLLAETVPKLREAGVLKDAYIYSFDEIQEQTYYSARTILEEVKRLYPDIPIVTTAFDSTFGRKSGLESCIDIWVPGENTYADNRERIQEARRNGKKVWYYTCMYRPGMNFLLEASATAPRLLVGLNQYKQESDGFLYYQTTKWAGSKLVDKGPLTGHDSRGYQAYNGDGLLLYPGRNGVMPTIRLKAIGDGFEDLEYWFLLKKLKASGEKLVPEDQAELDALLKVNPEVVVDFEHFDHTGDKLQAERLKAGELLSKYAR